MISARYCQMMAAYNAWMNARTYDCCAQLDDAERKRDRGAFFGSIHRTLNHLLWGDRVWLPRFGGPTLPVGRSGEDLYADFAELRAARAQMDAHISDWAARVDDAALAGDLTWFSGVAQRELTRPMALCVTQMFNHLTHHRAQVGTLLKQTGIDPGVTDLQGAPLAHDAAGRIVVGEVYAL